MKKILRLPETKERTGLSTSTIRRLEIAGIFPKRVRLGLRGVGHYENEVDKFLLERERVTLTGQEV